VSAPYDLAIIGGGINGAGIARDAAGRGLSVILFEKGDLANATSSASTKLIHGGLRYLEHYAFRLVRESLKERERLLAIAPHIAWPMRFVLPYQPGLRPRWMLRAGLFLYDHIGGRKRLPPTRSLDLRNDPAGQPLVPCLAHAFEYSDAWVDDARLVVLNARDAADRGAHIHTRTEVTGLHRAGSLWHVTAGTHQVQARAVINAAGPWVMHAFGLADQPPTLNIRQVRGSHIVVKRLFDHDRAYFFQNPDGRICFAIPYERDFTLIGTTDADHQSSLDGPHASADEIAYLCGIANGYFRPQIAPADVVWSYSGVRPLLDDGSGKPESATRDYRIEVDGKAGEAPLVSIFGGKITTYRKLAEAVMGKIAPFFHTMLTASWTGDAPLPGGGFDWAEAERVGSELAGDYPFLGAATAHRMIRLYGRTAWDILGDATSAANLGRDFGAGLYEAEVRHLVTREWAQTAEDIIWRRTKLGLRLSGDQVAVLDAFLAT
jgi:glycerol-3-phosphate dehydrogenase